MGIYRQLCTEVVGIKQVLAAVALCSSLSYGIFLIRLESSTLPTPIPIHTCIIILNNHTISRSQKPIAFTAMKFTKISLKTYSLVSALFFVGNNDVLVFYLD